MIVTLGQGAHPSSPEHHREHQTKLRGTWQNFQNIRVMPTFHPSYLLRFPRERLKTWDDMQQVMEYLADHEED